MKKFSIIVFLLVSILCSDVNAQKTGKGFYIGTFQYSTTFNIGRAHDYVSNVSFWGASFSIKKFISQSVTVGFNLSHNVLSNKYDDGTTEVPNGIIAGPQARYLNYTPMLFNIGYVFNKGYMVRVFPYIQANFGGYYIWERLQLGANFKSNNNFHFGAGPEAGIIFYMGKRFGLNINANYNYAFSGGDPIVGRGDENTFTFFNANIGISYINK